MKAPWFYLGLALCTGKLVSTAEEGSANWSVGQVVKTSSGSVTGRAASVNEEVSEYLGIPYAVPPVGDLRWTAPQKYSSTKDIDGTQYGHSCPSAGLISPTDDEIIAANVTISGVAFLQQLGQNGDRFSEDCLTLNVWTKPQVGDSKKAVLVWIHGGGFNTGAGTLPGYNGQFFADQEDVVLVTFNYRLNILGFPGNPGGAQNLGLLDQRLAIEWVRDNIESFGGDPSRITLFGQSAGSGSVDYHSYAWVDDPIAHAYIEQSGSAFGPGPGIGAMTPDRAADYWFNITTTLDCGNAKSDEAETLTCMKSKSYTSILKAIAAALGDSLAAEASFGPTVDEKSVFSDYPQRAIAGNFSKLPLLTGNTDHESGLFRVLLAFEGSSIPDSYWDAFNTFTYVCPAAARANASITNNVPTWRYRWFGAFPNTQLSTVPYSGAYHASELPVLFGTTPSGSEIPDNTDAETEIGSYIRGAWATFAKDPTCGLTTYRDGWPKYVPGEETLIQLGYQNKTGANLALGNSYDELCDEFITVKNSDSDPSSCPASPGTPTDPVPTATPTGDAASLRVLSFVNVAVVLLLVVCLSIV